MLLLLFLHTHILFQWPILYMAIGVSFVMSIPFVKFSLFPRFYYSHSNHPKIINQVIKTTNFWTIEKQTSIQIINMAAVNVYNTVVTAGALSRNDYLVWINESLAVCWLKYSQCWYT